MKILPLLAAAALVGGCYTESTHTRTWSAAPATGPAAAAERYGRVVQVQEVVRETRGRPLAGAATGALLGGVIFGSAGAAAVGGGIGAITSSGHASQRVFEVTVRFDNGESGVFDFKDWAPFRPNDLVVLTPNGLQPR